MILETYRLALRELMRADSGDLREILQDAQTMYAYEHAFSDAEADDWLARQRRRYEEDGFGLWAVLRRSDGVFVGQAGITMQEWDGMRVPEIGYLLNRRYWHMGYAAEAAAGCMAHAFGPLGLGEVYAFIRENNLPSRAVAERCGMRVAGLQIKHYYGMDMPHLVYRTSADEYRGRTGQ